MLYRKKPVVVEAHRWLRNGDHPNDYPVLMQDREARAHSGEGEVVRYFRRPDVSGGQVCEKCLHTMHDHGWIDTLEGGHTVCPGDYIITGVEGEHYPCKPQIFEATYERVEPEGFEPEGSDG